MPHTQSETVEEGIANIREAIELYLETLLEDGPPIPQEDIFIKPIEITAGVRNFRSLRPRTLPA